MSWMFSIEGTLLGPSGGDMSASSMYEGDLEALEELPCMFRANMTQSELEP